MRPEDFWEQIHSDIRKAVYESMGRRMIVDAIEGALIRIKDVRGEPAGLCAYCGTVTLEPDDEVWVEPVGNLHVDRNSMTALQQWMVIGKITR